MRENRYPKGDQPDYEYRKQREHDKKAARQRRDERRNRHRPQAEAGYSTWPVVILLWASVIAVTVIL